MAELSDREKVWGHLIDQKVVRRASKRDRHVFEVIWAIALIAVLDRVSNMVPVDASLTFQTTDAAPPATPAAQSGEETR